MLSVIHVRQHGSLWASISLWLPSQLGHMGRGQKTEGGEATQIFKLSLAVISQWPQQICCNISTLVWTTSDDCDSIQLNCSHWCNYILWRCISSKFNLSWCWIKLCNLELKKGQLFSESARMTQHTVGHPKTFAVHSFLTYGIQLKHRDKPGLVLLSDLLTHPAGTNHPVIMIPITQPEFSHSGWLQWATEKLLGWWSGGER